MTKHFNPMAGDDIECNECSVMTPKSDSISCSDCGYSVCGDCILLDDKCPTCDDSEPDCRTVGM